MALHPKLQPYSDRKYIRKLNRVLWALDKDIGSVASTGLSVDLLEEEDSRSFTDKLLQLQHEYHCDRVMLVETRLMDHDSEDPAPTTEYRSCSLSLICHPLMHRHLSCGYGSHEPSTGLENVLTSRL